MRKDGGRKHFLFDSFWEQIHVFSTVTTFHGIRNIFDRETNIVRRSIYFVVVVGLIFLLIWFCQDQFNRYFEYRTLNKQTVTFEEMLTFPAVTICSYNLVQNSSVSDDRERVLLKNLFMERPNRTFLLQTLGEEYLRNVSLRSVFINESIPLTELFQTCHWEARQFTCSEHLDGRLTDSGYCFTVNALSEHNPFFTTLPGSRYGLDLVLWTNQNNYFISDGDSAGFKILVHDRNVDPDMGLATALAPGFTHYIAVSRHEYRYIPHPVKAFGTQECVDIKSEPFLHLDIYSVHGCIQGCREDYIYKICGCTGILDRENRQECDPLATLDCYNQAYLNFTTYSKMCRCPVPCDVTKFETKVSSAYFPNINYLEHMNKTNSDAIDHIRVRENLLKVRVFYESKVITKHEQVLEFTFEDLWAAFGGYTGLAVGASAVTFVEFLEMMTLNLIHYVVTFRRLARGDL